jgi:glycosyltransferase involved in cell wall biosynthesis
MLRSLSGAVDGVSSSAERQIMARIAEERITQVYLNGSNLGYLARRIRRASDNPRLLTFFHNVEARFFLGSLRRRPSARAAGVLIANYRAERMAVRFSDRLIALSARDSVGLRRFYGRAATDILPMAMADERPSDAAKEAGGPAGDYLLFVGGAFYANVDGIAWFVEKVVPHISMKVRIVGHGLESVRDRLERNDQVEVIGGAERLDGWYRGAAAAIAPIFDGSGMKTKVAEALMFGKRILGTREAFSGYEEVAARAGAICETAEDFIGAIRQLESQPAPAFDPALRGLYERHYSRTATERRLAAILA